MRINKKNALRLWEMCFGDNNFAEDFHGYLMCREGCTNIATNDEAADKITFWIDDCLYQVKKTEDGHDIFQIK